MKLIILILSTLLCTSTSWARNQTGRLGVGFTQQFVNDVPALSFKLQKSSGFAMGAMAGMKLDDQDGGYAAGLKFYRIIFDEPQLNFYGATMLGLINDKENNQSKTGFQFDFTLGSEFHIPGLDSIGFSFEFGLSLNKLRNDLVIETMGDHIIKAAVHFYL